MQPMRLFAKSGKKMARMKNADEWMNDFFLAGVPELQNNKLLLAEARKYVPIVKQYAQDINDAGLEGLANPQVDEKLRSYLELTKLGEGESWFRIQKFKQWLECQTMMGIMHGNTLTATRLLFTKYAFFDGHVSDVFSKKFDQLSVVLGTVLGLRDDHNIINREAHKKHKTFLPIVEKYERNIIKLQKDFWDSLSDDDKNRYGWIKSVWGPNMFDNSQLTITTYV